MCWSSDQIEWSAPSERRRVVDDCESRSVKADDVMHHDTLLREMQHRVANSLQIVAGILLLKARTVTSEDARLYVLDAYGRVMSVAAVQRQLLESKYPSIIRLDDYLSELIRTLAQSLTNEVSLSVVVDGSSTVESRNAVAIGLIVTELVINALRHAFPGNRQGKIIVTYRAMRSGWVLSVSDDGVGQSNTSRNTVRSGYGTKIIDALTRQLDARVEVKSDAEGTCVSVSRAIDGVENDACRSAARATKEANQKLG